MAQRRVISGIYDNQYGNIYAVRGHRSRSPKSGAVTIKRPVVRSMGGVEFMGEETVNVIKSPRRKPLDKEQRKWYACLSK